MARLVGLLVLTVGLSACCHVKGPVGTCDVTAYGAKGDGVTMNTKSLQAAIDDCSSRGGGVVVVPPGTFRTGSLFLKDHVELHLSQGAKLLASDDLADYNADDAYPENFWEEVEGWCGKHFILAIGATDVAITGGGTIDGNGKAFFDDNPTPTPKGVCWRDGLCNSRKGILRPGPTVVFVRCREVRLTDVRLQDMTSWSCSLLGCEDVRIRGLRVDNPLYRLNTDGISVDCCRRVTITGCVITSGDDSLAIRCQNNHLKDAEATCEHVTVSDCVCRGSACGVRVGVGSGGAIRHVNISNMTFDRCGRGLAVQSSYWNHEKGVNISDIKFSSISMTDVVQGIFVVAGRGQPTAEMRDISFSNISAQVRGMGVIVAGKGKTRPTVVTLQNVLIEHMEPQHPDAAKDDEIGIPVDPLADVFIAHADDVTMQNIRSVRDGKVSTAKVIR